MGSLNHEEILKRISVYCPNYDVVLRDFIVTSEDRISEEIRNKYTDFVIEKISRDEDLENVKRLDSIIGEYILQGNFYDIVQKKYSEPLYDSDGIECIVDFYERLDLLYSDHEKQVPIENTGRWVIC